MLTTVTHWQMWSLLFPLLLGSLWSCICVERSSCLNSTGLISSIPLEGRVIRQGCHNVYQTRLGLRVLPKGFTASFHNCVASSLRATYPTRLKAQSCVSKEAETSIGYRWCRTAWSDIDKAIICLNRRCNRLHRGLPRWKGLPICLYRGWFMTRIYIFHATMFS